MSILATLGGILILVGWIWAIVVAFKTSGALWGILNIIPIQPLIGIISAALKKTAWAPVGIMILGVILSYFGGGMLAIGR
jgi:hypothetical protein